MQLEMIKWYYFQKFEKNLQKKQKKGCELKFLPYICTPHLSSLQHHSFLRENHLRSVMETD